ncbi:MAG: S8 family peptidase [Chloroflexota bacterium]
MTARRAVSALAISALLLSILVPGAVARSTKTATTLDAAGASALCDDLFGDTYDVASTEPLASCQWDMSLINANDATRARATGKGVVVGVVDSGVDLTHADIVANLDLARSCSFIFDHDALALDIEKGNGDCSNKAAVQDHFGHGTHVSSIIAAPINGVGIAGVAPQATIVAIKACNWQTFCFADSVAAAIRYAGDIRVDVVNMSLFADPYLYYCGNDAEQRAQYRSIQSAVRYAQQRGVLMVVAAGNQADDMAHPTTDVISPDWPRDAAVERVVHNNCKRAPTEIPGVLAVSATGPVGIEDYTTNIASYSDTGIGVVGVTAPGGDYFAATGTVQDAVLAATTSTDDARLFAAFAGLPFPGLTVTDGGARYVELNGTSMASPHAAGVAALIVERHPGWSPGAVSAAVQRTASPLACPADWEPLFEGDLRTKCYGNAAMNSFFGHGIVDAWAATHGVTKGARRLPEAKRAPRRRPGARDS